MELFCILLFNFCNGILSFIRLMSFIVMKVFLLPLLTFFIDYLACFWIPTLLLLVNPAIYRTSISLLFNNYLRACYWNFLICPVNKILVTMSIKKCCVPNCKTTRAEKITLHLFPNPNKDNERFNLWKMAIGGSVLSLDSKTIFAHRRVCHLHFESFYHTRSKRLSPNAIPTILLSEIHASTRPPLQDVSNRTINEDEPIFTPVSAPSIRAQTTLHDPTLILQSSLSLSNERELTMKIPIRNVATKNVALNNKIKALQKSKDSLKSKLKKALKLTENSTFVNILQKITSTAFMFTMLQFREAGKNKLGRRFKDDEKLMALAFYKQGPRAYRWLRKFFILPSPLTISRIVQNASLQTGINSNVFKQLQKVASKMSTQEKLCVLLFDEISLSPNFDYNTRSDKISGFVDNGKKRQKKIADHALVFMLRGMYKNYKQPISYTFCASTTPKMDLIVQIKTVIGKLYEVGFIVVATVCDQGCTNVSAIKYLVNETKQNYISKGKEFRHNIFEVDENEIIPLYDVPHLIKGIRNNVLNKNITCVIDGHIKTGTWDHILKLYNENPAYQGIRLMPKLTERHVIPNKIPKMKVKFATQVFSQTVAANMGYLAGHGILPKECQETADILMFFDKLFDSFNGSYTKAKKKGGKPLLGAVTRNSVHKKLWSESKPVLKTMKFIKQEKSVTAPSVTNWLQTLENVEYMINRLSEKYNLTSIWMRHFNQDPLENFFGCIRSHGFRNTSPTCSGFEAAFASLLVNNLSNRHSPGSNCEEDSCRVFKSLKTIFFDKCITTNSSLEVDLDDIDIRFIDIKEKNCNVKIKAQLEFVTGYVLLQLKKKIFKKCEKCNKSLMSTNKESIYLSYREYFKNKCCLMYPSINIIQCFSQIQDIVTNIIKKDCTRVGIKVYIKTLLSVVINYRFIDCEQHKEELIKHLENISINLFLFNWCKDCNKIIKGSRADFDENDCVQKMCFDYCKKYLKNKCRK